MLVRIVLMWLALVAGLWLASRLIAGVRFASPLALWGGALTLGILDATAGPVLLIATFPFTVITLGLFVFVVNAAVLMLAAALVPGFDVEGPLPAFNAGLILAGFALAAYLLGEWVVEGGVQWQLAGRVVGAA